MEENSTELLVSWSNGYSLFNALSDAMTSVHFWLSLIIVALVGFGVWYVWHRFATVIVGRGDDSFGEKQLEEKVFSHSDVTRRTVVSRGIIGATAALVLFLAGMMLVNTYTEGKNNDFRNTVADELADIGFFISGGPPGYGESSGSVTLSRSSSFTATDNCVVHNATRDDTHVITITCGTSTQPIGLR